MTEAVAQAGDVKPVSTGETLAQKLQKQQAEINKRILDAMASSNDESDVGPLLFAATCSTGDVSLPMQ